MTSPSPAAPAPEANAGPLTDRPDRLARIRPWTRGALIANVVGQIVIIGTGGAVRLTDSGLGCSTWPNCEPGQFTPAFHQASTIHPYIEFGNRTLAFVLGIVGVLVLVLVCTDRTRARSYRALGAVPLAGVVAQAVIGGVVVLLHLHPGWVSLHFGVSAALVWFSAYLLHRHGEGDGPPERIAGRGVATAGALLGLLLVPIVTLGVLVTGAGPHSGDTEVGYRLALDPLTLTRAHSATVWLFLLTLAALLVVLSRAPGGERVLAARRGAWLLVAVTLAQGAVGYVQYFTGLPELLVGVHLVGAGCLTWATANAVLRLRTRA
ncbi:COX15/CtaA family protein [Isoptericola sp. 4D.3]|uniref:COX15/CtaA family protein n=1 Tax=Isoptericola peretonis TaxID=2918523 RepID=A0ABT0J2Y8_9MICO|nr:COX15/CtaA family protein [Isoptericola sp. 4D.3]